MTKTFDVFAYIHGAPAKIGTVKGESQTHADRKAQQLYRHHTVWTKERVTI
jgi:hypothetical protein